MIHIRTSLLVASLAFSFACSSTENAKETNTAANVQPEAAASGPVPYGNTDAQTLQQKSDKAFAAADPASAGAAEPPPGKYLTVPLPEDSEIRTEMNSAGLPIETRTFRSHPSLIKVERVWTSPKDKKFKVYLKGGKVVEVADAKIPNFNTASTHDILVAAGVAGPAQDPGIPVRGKEKSAAPAASDDEKSKQDQ